MEDIWTGCGKSSVILRFAKESEITKYLSSMDDKLKEIKSLSDKLRDALNSLEVVPVEAKQNADNT